MIISCNRRLVGVVRRQNLELLQISCHLRAKIGMVPEDHADSLRYLRDLLIGHVAVVKLEVVVVADVK